MKALPVTPQITQLTFLWFINAFLVREDDGFTVVDTALGFAAKGILAAAAAQNLPIRRILLTHAHADHIGALDKLHAAVPAAEFLIGERESRLYKQAQQGVKTAKLTLEPGEPQTRVKGDYPKCTTPVTRTFNDGDHIGSLRAVFTPGHTPGHMSFLDERSGTVIAGDALFATGALRIVGDPRGFAGTLGAWFTWHKITALESGLRIAMLNPERVVCGHGGPVTGNLKTKLADALDSAGQKFAHD
jgi:glyoxylase-like metal-dependent hydrolase (beta-lactamase superfamily II)